MGTWVLLYPKEVQNTYEDMTNQITTFLSLKYLIQSTFVIFSVSLLFKKTDIMVNRPFVNLRSGVWQPSAGVYLHPRKQCFWLVISLSRYTETLIMSRDITGSEPICSAARPGRRAETISQGE